MARRDGTRTLADERREVRHQLLLNRPCKGCGNPIGSLDKRQVKCGLRCPGFSLSVECRVCGKRFEKRTNRSRKNHCCSLSCQREFALVRNRHRKEKDWQKASESAKKKWKRTNSVLRWKSNKWLPAIASKLSNTRSRSKQSQSVTDVWTYHIIARLGSASGRVAKKRTLFRCSSTVAEAIEKIEMRRKWFELDPWRKKITNKLSNQKHRRRRKDEIKKQSQGRGYLPEDTAKWVQVCIEWMDDNT